MNLGLKLYCVEPQVNEINDDIDPSFRYLFPIMMIKIYLVNQQLVKEQFTFKRFQSGFKYLLYPGFY